MSHEWHPYMQPIDPPSQLARILEIAICGDALARLLGNTNEHIEDVWVDGINDASWLLENDDEKSTSHEYGHALRCAEEGTLSVEAINGAVSEWLARGYFFVSFVLETHARRITEGIPMPEDDHEQHQSITSKEGDTPS